MPMAIVNLEQLPSWLEVDKSFASKVSTPKEAQNTNCFAEFFCVFLWVSLF